jgi:hypothetical protein
MPNWPPNWKSSHAQLTAQLKIITCPIDRPNENRHPPKHPTTLDYEHVHWPTQLNMPTYLCCWLLVVAARFIILPRWRMTEDGFRNTYPSMAFNWDGLICCIIFLLLCLYGTFVFPHDKTQSCILLLDRFLNHIQKTFFMDFVAFFWRNLMKSTSSTRSLWGTTGLPNEVQWHTSRILSHRCSKMNLIFYQDFKKAQNPWKMGQLGPFFSCDSQIDATTRSNFESCHGDISIW